LSELLTKQQSDAKYQKIMKDRPSKKKMTKYAYLTEAESDSLKYYLGKRWYGQYMAICEYRKIKPLRSGSISNIINGRTENIIVLGILSDIVSSNRAIKQSFEKAIA
jgi:hypothetical protein